jgi:hypothetical protein
VTSYFELSGQDAALVWSKYLWPLGVAALLVVSFIGTTLYVSVRYTHEIYGPLVSIHRFLDEILEGSSPAPLVLRQSDQLKDLATKLNQLAERKFQ